MMGAIVMRELDMALLDEAPTDANGESSDEKAKYIKICEEMMEKTVKELKDLLRHNDQTMSGTKQILCERIADCKLYGILPRCEVCGGAARLKLVSYISQFGHGGKGRYYCPGYFDDEGVWQR